MTNTPSTPKKTVRFAEKLVSAAHEPKIYDPPEQDSKSKTVPKDKKDEGKTQEVEEIIDFSILDIDDPRRIWAEVKAEIMATFPALPETTPALGDKKDEPKDPKIKKEKSSRKKSSKSDKKKSSSGNKDTKGDKDKSTSRRKDSKSKKTESSDQSEAVETEKTEPPRQSESLEAENTASSTDKEAKAKTPSSDSTKIAIDGPETPAANSAITWVFPAEEQEDIPSFTSVSRKTYGISTYPMDADYTPPAHQSRITAEEKRGYQLGNWKEDVPYTAGENERSAGLGFEYGSKNWKRERTAYAKVWGHLDEAEAAAKKRESGVAVEAAS